jgi:hypothetical protein
VGADVVVERFSKTNWTEFNDRKGAWIDALGVARAFPVAGTGLNTYSTAARFYQQHDLRSFYGEAHNDYLQLLAEGGALVAFPALACFVALIREIRRRMKRDLPGTSWWLRRAAVAALVAIALAFFTLEATQAGAPALAAQLLLMLGGVAGFLVLNLRYRGQPRARVFLGNSGIALLGLTVAWGAFGLAANDSALITTLQPGNYTAQVVGAGGATGVALIEVYELP